MAFELCGHIQNTSSPFVNFLLMTDAEGCTKGQALVLSSGRLTNCGATTTPQYIAQKTVDAATSSTEYVPCIMVTEEQVWKSKANATVASTLVGAKVTLHTDGLLVTATTASGVFEIVSTDGATDGGVVKGMFRR
jgi:hypothetical protein